MNGINAGILTNASPLTEEQIESLEQQILNTGGCVAYLDQDNNICFMSNTSPDSIKDLAWHKAYQLTSDESLNKHNKNIYQHVGIDSMILTHTYQRSSTESTWAIISSTSNLLDEAILDELILD